MSAFHRLGIPRGRVQSPFWQIQTKGYSLGKWRKVYTLCHNAHFLATCKGTTSLASRSVRSLPWRLHRYSLFQFMFTHLSMPSSSNFCISYTKRTITIQNLYFSPLIMHSLSPKNVNLKQHQVLDSQPSGELLVPPLAPTP
jgi:hypothetical protein